MSVFGIALGVIGMIPKVVNIFKGDEKPGTLDVFSHIISNIMPQINLGLAYGKWTSKEQVDAWLKTLDESTGTDAGALDLFKDIPGDKEEELFDHLKEFLRIYLYARIGVEGYVQKAA